MSKDAVATRYRREEVIGRGNFGVVYKGVDLEARRVVAIKVLDLDTAEDDLLDIQQEINTLSNLTQSDAVNITKYFGSYLLGTKLWIIMDLCSGGSVRSLLKPGRFDEKYTSVIMREVLLALSYIHKEGIIHRDIKAANILVSNDGRVRLCDFGVAAQVTTNKLKRSTIVGTPYWMAPEVITEGATYNTKADIWSLGVTLFEIATGNPPHADQDAFRAIMLIPRQKPARLEGSQYSGAIKEFVAHCLDEHPEERPTADELTKLRFIKGSRSVPTTALHDLVSRYRSWREKNHARDSVAMIKGIKLDDGMDQGDGRRHSVASNYSASSEDSDRWDFDTSDMNGCGYEYDGQPTYFPDGAGAHHYGHPHHLDTLGNASSISTHASPPEDQLNGLGFTYPGQATATAPTIAPFGSHPSAVSRDGTVREIRHNASSAAPTDGPKSLLELFEGNQGDGGVGADGGVGGGPPQPGSLHGTPVTENFSMHSLGPPPPATPTVEIEIPSFDAMESETNLASTTHASTVSLPTSAQASTTHSLMQAAPPSMSSGPPSAPPPSIPPPVPHSGPGPGASGHLAQYPGLHSGSHPGLSTNHSTPSLPTSTTPSSITPHLPTRDNPFPNGPPPPIPARSRSNTLTPASKHHPLPIQTSGINGIPPQPLSAGPMPPLSTNGSTQSLASAAMPVQPASATAMLPPQLPHSLRRTPSPKRMAKAASGASAAAAPATTDTGTATVATATSSSASTGSTVPANSASVSPSAPPPQSKAWRLKMSFAEDKASGPAAAIAAATGSTGAGAGAGGPLSSSPLLSDDATERSPSFSPSSTSVTSSPSMDSDSSFQHSTVGSATTTGSKAAGAATAAPPSTGQRKPATTAPGAGGQFKKTMSAPSLVRGENRLHISMPPPSLPVSAIGSFQGTPSTSHPLTAQSQSQSQWATAEPDSLGPLQDDLNENLVFPTMPKLDVTTLLDSNGKEAVVAHLDTMLGAFDDALAVVEKGLNSLLV